MLFASNTSKTLSNFDEIAIVTGCFGSSAECITHIKDIVTLSARHGFHGRLMYMGSEIGNRSEVAELLDVVKSSGLSGLRLVFTVECFENRSRFMRGQKGSLNLNGIIDCIQELHEGGLESVEYSYIPGFDNLDAFAEGIRRLKPLALPHVCILSPWKDDQREKMMSVDCRSFGPEYLTQMRRELESLYGGPIYGNNLANLWPFPKSRLDARWFDNNIVGPSVGRRHWEGEPDLRANDIQIVEAGSGK